MTQDRQCAEKSKGRREIPPLAKEKKVAPETASGSLGGHEQCVPRVQVQTVTQNRCDGRISRKEPDVGNFHDFVVNRRDDRLVAAIDNVHEPVTIVLHESAILVGERALWCEEKNGHRDLRQSQKQAGEQRSEY